MTNRMKELNWEEIWEYKRKQRMKPMRITYDPMFRAKFADDYPEQAKYNNYEYGRKAVGALSEILDNDVEVLHKEKRSAVVMWWRMVYYELRQFLQQGRVFPFGAER